MYQRSTEIKDFELLSQPIKCDDSNFLAQNHVNNSKLRRRHSETVHIETHCFLKSTKSNVAGIVIIITLHLLLMPLSILQRIPATSLEQLLLSETQATVAIVSAAIEKVRYVSSLAFLSMSISSQSELTNVVVSNPFYGMPVVLNTNILLCGGFASIFSKTILSCSCLHNSTMHFTRSSISLTLPLLTVPSPKLIHFTKLQTGYN